MLLITIRDKNKIIKRLVDKETNSTTLIENLKEMLLENGYPREKMDKWLGKEL
tara:strand:- start:695 stop:853 length:159 start_codon:yes stop_codon:yes gene_type:complete